MKKLFLLLPVLTMMLACGSDDDYGPSWRDRDYHENNNQGDGDDRDPNDFGVYPSDNHAYVDLGLSVLWATCNVGATSEEQPGGYYFWGDPTGTATLEYMIENDPAKQYSYICGSDYDIVHVMWGEKWRMPTPDEREELFDNCTFRWKRVNNVWGALFTSQVKGFEGNSIFLPAVGGYDGDSLVDHGIAGYYWTDELGEDNEGVYVHSIVFDEQKPYYDGWNSLDARLPVRPVFGDVPSDGNSQGSKKVRARAAKTIMQPRSDRKGFATRTQKRQSSLR